jgi:NTE family protein
VLSACAGSKPNVVIPVKAPPILHLQHTPRVALVLGGGGARGYAHVGVISALQKAGVPIDLIVGTSAGSIFGSLYADQGNITKETQAVMAAGFWDFADIENYPSPGGIMQGYHIQKFLLQHMQAKRFNQLKIPFVVITTNLLTGKVFPISSGPVAPAVEASAAIPGLIKPVHLYGRTLVDGGMADPIGVNVAKQYHPKMIIAVNIAQQLTPTLPTSTKDIKMRAYIISRINMTEMSARGADVIIRPQVGQASVFDIKDKHVLYAEGQAAAEKALPKIKALLKQKGIPLKTPPTATPKPALK